MEALLILVLLCGLFLPEDEGRDAKLRRRLRKSKRR